MKKITILLACLALIPVSCKKKEKKADTSGGPPAGEMQPAMDVMQPEAMKPEAMQPDKPKDPPKAKSNLATLGAGFAAYSKGDIDGATKNFTDDVVWTNTGMGPAGVLKGKAAVKAFMTMNRKAFPDSKVTPKTIYDAGDTVVVEAVVTGTHKGPFMGLKATDKTIGAPVAYWFTMKDGKVAKVYAYLDMLTVMQQAQGAKGPNVAAKAEAPSGAPKIIKGKAEPKTVELYKKMVAIKMSDKKIEKHIDENTVIYSGEMNKEIKGLKIMRKLFGAQEKAFPDSKENPLEVVSIGNWALARLHSTGTHKGDLGKLKATNKQINMHILHIGHFDGEKLKWGAGYGDRMGLLIQLGVIKPPPAPGAMDAGMGAAPPAKKGGMAAKKKKKGM